MNYNLTTVLEDAIPFVGGSHVCAVELRLGGVLRRLVPLCGRPVLCGYDRTEGDGM